MKKRSFLGQVAGLFLCLVCGAVASGQTSFAENWPRFRGQNGTGTSAQKGFPVAWTDQDYLWKSRIPGLGHSCPCVWEDHVFLTSAEEEGKQRLVIDVSASTGEIRWIQRMDSETHVKNERNSYASATPATDGQRVYVAFSKESEYALLAFNHDTQRRLALDQRVEGLDGLWGHHARATMLLIAYRPAVILGIKV